jgi:hypothetical protein
VSARGSPGVETTALRGSVFRAAVILAALSAAAVPGRARQEQEKPRRVTCSFSNPSYSGYCRQDASVPEGRSPEEVCQGILKCLNDVRCVQTYCNATEIRGHWKLEAVEVRGEKK